MSNAGVKRFRVAIVGAGPAGIGVATELAALGVKPVLLIERALECGGIPARYAAKPGGVPTFVAYGRGRIAYGREFLVPLVERLLLTSTEIWRETQVLTVEAERKRLTVLSPLLGKCTVEAEAIVFATGAREQTAAERGWIAGARPAGVLFTPQLVELLDRHGCVPARAAVVGSDLIAYSVAAKLRGAGAESVVLIDRTSRPQALLPGRLYFRAWGRTTFSGGVAGLRVEGERALRGLSSAAGEIAAADAVVLAGGLVPNSELIVECGLAMTAPGRIPVVRRDGSLSAPGLFAAGNVLGGWHGADWCHRHGRRVGRRVAKWVRRGTRDWG
jgi:pyruvate/2-oxoglutarate dehydrogenase complex dihydrolipoamide dehydrogenase (E3) component